VNAVRALLLCAVSSGCTAAKAQFQILSAEESLHDAERDEVVRAAAYEHEMAVLYLEKAREEAGFSQNRVADALARKSTEWSGRAVSRFENQGRVDLRVEDFAEEVAPPPPPTDALGVPEPEPEPEPDNPFADDPEEDIDIDLAPPAPAPKPAPKPRGAQ
jgi:hypothetical protein